MHMYLAHILDLGFAAGIEDNGDIGFKCGEYHFYINMANADEDEDDYDDEHTFELVAPNIWSVNSPEEGIQVARAVAKVNSQLKVTKIYPFGDKIWASVEIFFAKPKDFKRVLERCAMLLHVGVQEFHQNMREQQNEQDVEATEKPLPHCS